MAGFPGAAIEISDEDELESNEKTGFDELKAKLLGCLDRIRTTGTVACSKQYNSFINPGLIVADSRIPLPLVPRDAETIKGTVVDTSVRKTWELDHTQFRFSNPEWQTYVASLLNDASQGLGMSAVRVEPYKLLLYEEGSFFKSHKDFEKTPGMIGTLVICLPSKHEGGSVRLSHAGQKYVFDTDKASEFGLTSLSWFSDVTHEIKPLISGYRLVLTYNIIYESDTRMSAGLVGKQSKRLRSILNEWQTGGFSTERLVYLLGHKYTQSSLSLSNLKGRDRAVCQSLCEAGSECGFAILLARMTRSQNDDDYYGNEDDNSTELEEIKTCDGLTICASTDIDEEDILGDNLWDRDPDSESEGEFTGNENMPSSLRYHDTVVMIVPMRHLGDLVSNHNPHTLMDFITRSLRDRPDDHNTRATLLTILEGAIKNENMYTSPDGALLSEVVAMAVKLQRMTLFNVAVCASLRSPTRQKLVFTTVAQLIDETFRKDPGTPVDWNFWLGGVATQLVKYPLQILAGILPQLDSLVQHEDLKTSFQDWKKPIPQRAVENKSMLDINDCDFLIGLLTARFNDSTWLADWFIPILASRGSKSKPLIYGILGAVYHIHEHNTLPDAKYVFQCVIEGCKKTLALQIGDLPKPSWSTKEHKFQCAEATSLRGFITVIHQGFGIGLSRQITELLENSCVNIYQSRSKAKYSCPIIVRYFLLNLTSALDKHNVPPLESVRDMYITLLRNVLITSPPKRPRKPPGWKHKPLACTPYCSDCKELNAFLTDSKAQTCEFRMPEKRRRHLQDQLPPGFFQCRTEKDHSPYKLVITKTGREYEESLKQYYNGLGELTKRVDKLQCEYVKSLLGDDLYQELVLLKDIVGPEGMQQTNKRKADEELEGSSASRPRLIE
ncbi:hypothetical protein F4818DRAFT_444892 [Hypoxylon cercidicola]|nr:hypothetical protein F4818DRAFT_444892 [Hypoxylon cercidicola]